jgi:hypothetical protein
MSVRVSAASNMAVERPAGSHSLAAAAHCCRSADMWTFDTVIADQAVPGPDVQHRQLGARLSK